MERRELLAALVECAPSAGIDEPLYHLSQRGQRSFAIAGNVEVHILEAAEILIIGLQVEIADAERNDLCVGHGSGP